MNRKDRRPMESADRRTAEAIGGLHAKMDRLVQKRPYFGWINSVSVEAIP